MVRGIERRRILRAAAQVRQIVASVWIEPFRRRASDLVLALNQACGNVSLWAKWASGQCSLGAAGSTRDAGEDYDL